MIFYGDINFKFAKCRNSRPEVFCKKGVLGNFAKFTGKHVCQALLFNIVAGLDLYRYFPVNFLCIFLRIFSGGCLPKHVVLKNSSNFTGEQLELFFSYS